MSKQRHDRRRATGKRSLLELDDSSLEGLRKEADSISVPLDAAQVAQLGLYLRELLRWNQKINLISVSGTRELLMRHVLDSLVPIPYLEGVKSLVDVGSGAGFPGIPIKIARPQMKVFLVEARRKRASFLEYAITRLCLKGIEVCWSRMETQSLAAKFSENPVDCIITRALGADEGVLGVAKSFLCVGGKIVLMKGVLSEPDLQALQKMVGQSGRRIARIASYRLPDSTPLKSLVLIE